MPKKEVKTKLTRADMEKIILEGGSIHHDGELITKMEDLPDDVDLAQNDEELDQAAAQLEKEEQALQQKKEKLAAAKAGNSKTTAKKSSAKDKDKAGAQTKTD